MSRPSSAPPTIRGDRAKAPLVLPEEGLRLRICRSEEVKSPEEAVIPPIWKVDCPTISG